ncbi:MAG: hypothetical protein PWQ13_806, partial [Bacillota bacterium]|nr:hypothetical protein [Bacillota bacterium]
CRLVTELDRLVWDRSRGVVWDTAPVIQCREL